MDGWLLVSMGILIFFGLAAIYSVALSQEGSDFLTVKKQAIALVIGLVCFFLFSSTSYLFFRSQAFFLYLLGILFLIGVLWFGTTIRGTTGWFDLGWFSFQPIEYMKVALTAALAAYYQQQAKRFLGGKELFKSILLILPPVILALLQPDLGSALLLCGLWFTLSLFAGMRRKQVFLLLLTGIVVGVISWFFFLADYQQARILTFLDPSLDPLGQGYNVTQAMIGIGAGGWFGSGLGFGSQSQLKFIPESQTDFIFAVIAEELGFVGVCVLLGAFALLFYRLFVIARRCRDAFGQYLLLAIGSVLFLQFVVNVGMNIGLLPVTGLGLPLVSYGGSSLVFYLGMMGLVQSVAIRSHT
ncbi:MAG: Rod shape-determining protein RodA [Candidatus Uhrbacteria bacterium GW2011_GWE2_46_68]|uniref:Rod shape-determining protein RodA n=2 Tax=Candidatus Uhriibacteriota TaxID=1752732 RepID=A0A0G1Q6R4_9BACT|nr:MAG: Rod shape-determining protein RodA [Candidatus Uhrbacteria bacterium GW2011_GWF2_46_218]KKU40679.1 MAG: Rod shape-determining protein RodA [Candidatus Uhrbacteria bacterium GW2011_GWE2_46_68]